MLGVGCTPVLSRLVRPEGGLRAHGCRWVYTPRGTTIVRAQSCLSACIDKAVVGGPSTHDDTHRCATGRTASCELWRGAALGRLASAGVCLHDHQADGSERESTTGMEKAAMTDFHKAVGQDMLEESADKLDGVEMGRTEAGTAHFTVGERNRAVLEAHDAAVGDGDPEDIRGEVGEGGVSVMIGLTVDVPGDRPHVGGDVLQQAGLTHIFFEDGSVDG